MAGLLPISRLTMKGSCLSSPMLLGERLRFANGTDPLAPRSRTIAAIGNAYAGGDHKARRDLRFSALAVQA
jgi:hypothetical protein